MMDEVMEFDKLRPTSDRDLFLLRAILFMKTSSKGEYFSLSLVVPRFVVLWRPKWLVFNVLSSVSSV